MVEFSGFTSYLLVQEILSFCYSIRVCASIDLGNETLFHRDQICNFWFVDLRFWGSMETLVFRSITYISLLTCMLPVLPSPMQVLPTGLTTAFAFHYMKTFCLVSN